MIKRAFLILCCMLSLVWQTRSGENDSPAKLQKIRSDYLRAAAELKSRVATLRGSGSFSIENLRARIKRSCSVELRGSQGCSRPRRRTTSWRCPPKKDR